MNDSANFENALDRLTAALKDVFRELHAAAPSAPAELSSSPAAPPAPSGPGTELLCTGFDRILSAANQMDTMQVLLDAAEGYAARCAILVVKGDRLTPWRWHGFEEVQQAGWRNLNVAADGDNGWRQAVGITGPLPQTLSRAFFAFVGTAKSGRAYLLPLTVRDRPVAMLYSDGGTTGLLEEGALRLLTRTAGIRLETMSGGPAKPAVAAPAPPQAAEPWPRRWQPSVPLRSPRRRCQRRCLGKPQPCQRHKPRTSRRRPYRPRPRQRRCASRRVRTSAPFRLQIRRSTRKPSASPNCWWMS